MGESQRGTSALMDSRLKRLGWVLHYARNNEAQFLKTVGRWDITAGFFVGFGLGFIVQQGEWDVTLGPFSVAGVRG